MDLFVFKTGHGTCCHGLAGKVGMGQRLVSEAFSNTRDSVLWL